MNSQHPQVQKRCCASLRLDRVGNRVGNRSTNAARATYESTRLRPIEDLGLVLGEWRTTVMMLRDAHGLPERPEDRRLVLRGVTIIR